MQAKRSCADNLTMPNLSQKAKAVEAFAKLLKKSSSRHGGWSMERLHRLVQRELDWKGFHSSPRYFLASLPGIIWDEGSLKTWRGSFYRTI